MAKRKSKAAEEPEPTPATPEAPEPPPPVLVPIAPTRIIELSPDCFKWFVWRKREVQKRPEPKPFDFAKCREQLAKLKPGYAGPLHNLYVDTFLSRQEAHYWFLAMMTEGKSTPAEVADSIAEKDITGKVELADAIPRITGAKTFNLFLAGRVLFSLFDPVELVELLRLERMQGYYNDHNYLVREFADDVLPYLTADELTKIRAGLRPQIDPAKWPQQASTRPALAFHLAAVVGMPDELLAVTRSIPDGYYGQGQGYHAGYHQTQRLVFGLGTPQLVESEMRRLKLPLRAAEYTRAWLAATQFSGLDYLAEQIRSESDARDSRDLAREFARVQAPEAAPYLLEMKLTTKNYYARLWLENNTTNAIFGLLAATTGRGKVADGAVEYLREAKRRGNEAVIRAALAQAPPEVAESVREHVLDYVEKTYPELAPKAIPKELKSLLDAAAKEKADEEAAKKAAEATKKKPSKPKPQRIPMWAEPSALPPILLDEHKLSDEHAMLVLDALSRSTLEKPDPLIVAVKKTMDATALDNFAWKLFYRWNDEDCPSNEKWALIAIGLLGGDNSALKITPLIRAWPGESAHKRAVFGLECLRAIGSDTALMQLNGISQKLKFKALKQKAAEAMESIAKQKGLSRAELEDRVVPDCDLDERGQRIFDFGARQFHFVLGPDMKPMVKDADGKLKPDLPKPSQKDDATKAGEAVSAWKLMKKQIKEVAKSQSMRLEQAMVTGRRWPVTDFSTLLVKHPMMIHLVRLLLWGGYGKKGTLTSTFRVTEDQTFADPKDAIYTPKDVVSVGVVHPLLLSDQQKSAWGEVFSDYEIVPPFAQLGRSVFRLEEKENDATEIARFNGVSISAATLVYGLEARGWIRIGGGYGNFSQHYKHFASSGVTAFVEYDGVSGYGYINPEENTSLGNCYFSSGSKEYSSKTDKLKLSEVDPIAVSEVINEISTLTAKAT